MNCETARNDLNAYLDGELPVARLEDVQSHVAQCPECRDLLTLLDSARTAFRDNKPERVSTGFRRKVTDAYHGTDTRRLFPWARVVAPVAMAAALALVFIWNGRTPNSPTPTGPMSGPEVYEQMLIQDTPGAGLFRNGGLLETIQCDSPGFNARFEGVDPDDTVPGMG